MESQTHGNTMVAQAMLQQLNAATADGLLAILREELVEEAREEALTLARAELDDEFQRRV